MAANVYSFLDVLGSITGPGMSVSISQNEGIAEEGVVVGMADAGSLYFNHNLALFGTGKVNFSDFQRGVGLISNCCANLHLFHPLARAAAPISLLRWLSI